MCLALLLYAYPQQIHHNLIPASPNSISSLHLLVTDGLFHHFLLSWAHNTNNPSLSRPPPSFHIGLFLSLTQSTLLQPLTYNTTHLTPGLFNPHTNPYFSFSSRSILQLMTGQEDCFSPDIFNPYTNKNSTSRKSQIHTLCPYHFKPYSLD
jgi:hypothetical protein